MNNLDSASNLVLIPTSAKKGGPGSGALSDLGSHTIDTGEFLNGKIKTIRGAYFSTIIKDRFLPLSAVVGHGHVEISDASEPVENEDSATFTCEFENGAIGTYTISRVAFGNPNGQTYAIHGPGGSAEFDMMLRTAEFIFSDASAPAGYTGPRTVIINDHTPFYAGSMAMDAPGGVGYTYNQNFAFQARAFLEEIAGVSDHLQPCATFADGLHTLKVIEAIVKSAARNGAEVVVEA